jgi:hypothetical protein
MPQDYCRFLNLPGPFFNKDELEDHLKKDLTVYSYNNPAGRHWRNWGYKNTPFDQQAHDWAESLGCEIVNAEVFYTKTKGILPWHVDMNPPGPVSKINFVWGSKDHAMEFSEIKNPDAPKPTYFTKVNSNYISYTDSEITDITSFTLDRPSLINVGKPHRIVNNSDVGRWCLCMILKKDNERILWHDALKLLNEYIEYA